MGGKDGSPGSGIFTPLRCLVAVIDIAAFIGTLAAWAAYFDRTWIVLLAYPVAMIAFCLVTLAGTWVIDRAEGVGA